MVGGVQARSQGLSSSAPCSERAETRLSSLAPGGGKMRDPGNEVGGRGFSFFEGFKLSHIKN